MRSESVGSLAKSQPTVVPAKAGTQCLRVRFISKARGPAFAGTTGYMMRTSFRSTVLPLQTIELETAPNPRHAIIWLHGLGADGNDFKPIVPELVDRAWAPIRFVFPNAPMQPVTINGGFVMLAWYDIYAQDLVRQEDERGIRESQALLEALVAREGGRGIPPDRIVLAGFSQGGVITLQTGLRQPKPLAGLVALSCYLPLAGAVAWRTGIGMQWNPPSRVVTHRPVHRDGCLGRAKPPTSR